MHSDSSAPTPMKKPRVAIVGSGFAGICMAYRLQKAGFHDFTIFEQSGAVGGTWRDNTYPGAACDVPSHLYSFSFAPNPDWSSMYGKGTEILAYTRRCVEQFGLAPHIRLNAKVASAVYDDATAQWRVTLADGTSEDFSFVVAGTGPLSTPAIPELPGLASFRGRAFHSARWDHDLSLEGKNVAVVGTGASAIQIVPAIAPRVRRLTLFQRTPAWVLPKPDREIGPRERALYRRFPLLQRLYRGLLYAFYEFGVLGMSYFPALLKPLQKLAERQIERGIQDPALRKKLVPNYEIGCKRILLANDFYATLGRENVGVCTERIRQVVPEGIVTDDGVTHPLDAIVFCTGFHVTDGFLKFPVRGPGGRDLDEHWAQEGVQAYLGTQVAGYPNLFFIIGPNTGLGHNSMIFMIEAQVNYIMSCLELTRRGGAASIDVRRDVQAGFNRWLRGRLRRSVWQSGCTSYYLDKDGNNTTLWPAPTVAFWARTRRAKAAQQELRAVPRREAVPA